MTDQQPNAAISASFPAPPPFYKHFTADNLQRLASLEAITTSETSSEASTQSISNLPSELRYLVPPPPPPSGQYRSFGEERNKSSPLPPLPPETPSLYPSPPTTPVLILLTRSLLLNFLELLHILATDPAATAYGPKWEDLRDLFRNAHQAVNEYRPFQAREALIELMEGQVERGRAEVAALKGLGGRVEMVLGGLGVGTGTGDDGLEVEIEVEGEGGRKGGVRRMGRRKEEEGEEEEEEKRVWQILREGGGREVEWRVNL